ncbi:UDP-N-acetylmuramoyl-L-alanine--D-glutamate ligase [Bacillus suaedae]|uniref:UDP-N-acetylmuramoylalanine--D-glutamate ligase n=1 Tax=Halalkalibacter suaedae TaxID=2822140 RepID=A0A940WWX7_9BACI|nr:UDP-N-acetylmuramoyl-L-alanine--D-glutamate ligase [Bacillus suaedae]MBP3952127.1 UDP-N-acetylmuramoyl-L-alanine--D-glutamate ligase [Bacillus suaedae]
MKKLEQFRGKHVLILGLAKSGEAAAKLLHKYGAIITVNDAKPYAENEQAKNLEGMGMRVVCGHHPVELLDRSFDYLVKNPGIPYTNPIVQEATNRGLPVITEVEISSLISDAEIIAITGSNGKTTTTTLVYEMLKNSLKTPHLAGNIGTVSCEVAEQLTEQDIMVLEVSSFQLLGTVEFKPKVSVLLNLFDAHLDYHGTKDEYIKAKSKITVNQDGNDYFVFNADDYEVAKVAQSSQATLVPFSTKKECDGLYIKDQMIYFKNDKLISLEEVVLPGAHNVENILAAIGASILLGANQEQIKHVLKTFTGVEHRLQFVEEFEGRRFYNDSKATNILATKKALEAFKQPIVLLAGGLDRGNEFTELKDALMNVHVLVAFGETKDKLAEAARDAGVQSIVFAEFMEDAVSLAFEQSNRGDVILLSPACASWDQYKTFEERGNRFVDAVRNVICK